jgi:hypothetical protein
MLGVGCGNLGLDLALFTAFGLKGLELFQRFVERAPQPLFVEAEIGEGF